MNSSKILRINKIAILRGEIMEYKLSRIDVKVIRES